MPSTNDQVNFVVRVEANRQNRYSASRFRNFVSLVTQFASKSYWAPY
ncbi:hypothetical protein H6CHR_02945 [Variovorax sp. PBL-H6]|nr:hypothetical protein H6CHR_02945 [Variovorax sp. PBL-H6]